jgi:hypothetical protein
LNLSAPNRQANTVQAGQVSGLVINVMRVRRRDHLLLNQGQSSPDPVAHVGFCGVR